MQGLKLQKIIHPTSFLPRSMNTSTTRLRLVYIAMSVVIVAPIIALLFSLFSGSSSAWEHIRATVLARYFINTIIFSSLVTLLATVIGIYSAWIVCRYDFPGRKIVEYLLLLPKAIPVYIIAYCFAGFADITGPFQVALRSLLGENLHLRMLQSFSPFFSLVIIMGLALYPYVYLAARIAFMKQSKNLIEVSQTMGKNTKTIFWRLSLPMGRPIIVTGILLVLMEVFNDYAAINYFGVETITTGIFRAWFLHNDVQLAKQFALILLALVVFVIVVESFLRRKRQSNVTTTGSIPRTKPSRAAGIRYLCYTLLPPLLGFGLPLYQLLYWLFLAGLPNIELFALIGKTLSMAVLVTGLCLCLAILLAYASYLLRHSRTSVLSFIFSCGYALPGSIIAVGIMILTGFFDNAFINADSQSLSNIMPVMMSGSLAVLVYAYLVRYMAVAHYSLYNFLQSGHGHFEEASRSLGKSARVTLLRVHLPLMWPIVLTGAVLVFSDLMRDLPLTLILRPFNFQTIAIKIHELVINEQLPAIALPSLILIVFGLLSIATLVYWERK